MSKTAARFLSLDVFRGLTVCLMIVVNTAGPGAKAYSQLVHAKWFGFTAADAVFPSFLFAVGCSMAFAFSKPIPVSDFTVKVLRRAALIFLLGFLMYWFPFVREVDGRWTFIPFSDTRVMGVLQRIALCYLLAAFAARWLSPRLIVALSAALLLGYWAILMTFGDPAAPLSKLGNAGTHLDLLLIGQNHLYRKDGGFDPEGLLGTLPSTVNVLAGYLAARFLKENPGSSSALARMAVVGVVLIMAGLAWSPLFPIAKKLWTGSFVLLTVGIDLVLLAGLTKLLEGKDPNRATYFFQVFGLNPLVIYLFSELFVTVLGMIKVAPDVGLYKWVGVNVFQAVAPGPLGSLLCAIAYMLVCWLLGYVMARRGVVVKL
ncbi:MULTISPECIES: acyltransferase family protein [unclassified Caulobacter]|uniref:acyltransferase family protein n=1 Tax=unclassified Caulobacter TaxID=2648921 RepID=UPI0007824F70|nr:MULTISPECIES: acyltransferase family protein [unclassified Caulobacter]AZS21834.1 acyltransferase family protein [Caulobacter sp. FWC26]